MSNLYQDAILDAKALRASAMANAKAALEEAFEPKIQEMISKHLSEEEAADMEEGWGMEEEGKTIEEAPVEETADINEAELEEILNQLEELEAPKEKSLNEAEEEEESEEEETEEEEGEDEPAEGEEEVTDDTKVIDITLGDLKQVIQSLMPGEQAMPDAEEEPTADSEAEEEVSLEEILDELSNEGMETSGHYDAPDVNPATAEAGSQVEEEGVLNEDLLASLGPDALNNLFMVFSTMTGGAAIIAALKAVSPAFKRMIDSGVIGKSMERGPGIGGGISDSPPVKKESTTKGSEELNEAKATIETLRKDLQEVNLLNAKYLYMNKLFKSKSLTESQKIKVINALDRAKNVKEVKNTYETIRESFETKKSQLKESVGFASKPAGVAPKANIMEADTFINRWQKLAGIK